MRKLLLLLLALKVMPALAQLNYAVSDIPSTLKSRAHTVIRSYNMTTEVKDAGQVICRVKKALTVLNRNGDSEARLVLLYDKSNKIASVKGAVYNELGLPVLRISEKNFADVSAVDGVSLYTDNRLKVYSPSAISYPYTVEYEYELRYRHSMYFPVWYPVSSDGVSLQNSAYTFLCKPNFKVRQRLQNYAGKADESVQGDYRAYKFSVQNKVAMRDEPYGQDPDDYLTAVHFSPENFEYAGLAGNMSSWNSYGKWFYDKLISGRDALSPQTVERIKYLTKDAKTDKEKIRILYRWMQQRMRYVSVQIGIGGLQPVNASEVDQLGYGDCKGLVNYMHALLRSVNIPSWYTIVSSGSEKHSFRPGFTSMDGDHVILCVPLKNDTTWLECTSKNLTAGFLSDFTDDRYVLACTPEGGKLMRTPAYPTPRNVQVRTAEMVLDSTGVLSGIMRTRYEGIQIGNIDYLADEPASEQKKLLTEHYRINNISIDKFGIDTDEHELARKNETLQFTVPNFATLNNNRLFFYPNLANRTRSIPAEIRNRSQKVCVKRGYVDEDEITYQIPQNFVPEHIPEPRIIRNAFGEFSSSVAFADGKLLYKRRIQLNEISRPAEEYADFIDFFQTIYDTDNQTLTFVRPAK